MAVFPDKTVTMTDLAQHMVDAEKLPSLPENFRKGNYLDAAFQGIGSIFDTGLLLAMGQIRSSCSYSFSFRNSS